MRRSLPYISVLVASVAARTLPSWPWGVSTQRQIREEDETRSERENRRLFRSALTPLSADSSPSRRQLPCASPVYGLSPEDCEYMSSIGMLGQGTNARSDNDSDSGIWIGGDGPNTFTFINVAYVPVTVVVWHRALGDDQASFLNARVPKISYSLPERGSAVVISLANGVPGGWSALYNRSTPLTQYGQVDNTFGEFSTGEFATIDISRLVNMSGNPVTVRVSGGCVADMKSCVYACDTGTSSCGAAGTYNLLGCGGPNAVQSVDPDGNPTGGCQGWSNGGHLDIMLE